MARSDGYNTKTRQLILDYLIRNRQHAVSASNILEHLEAEGASPNPTTVYRYLDKLPSHCSVKPCSAIRWARTSSMKWQSR